jgi:hypothetical protein
MQADPTYKMTKYLKKKKKSSQHKLKGTMVILLTGGVIFALWHQQRIKVGFPSLMTFQTLTSFLNSG